MYSSDRPPSFATITQPQTHQIDIVFATQHQQLLPSLFDSINIYNSLPRATLLSSEIFNASDYCCLLLSWQAPNYQLNHFVHSR